MYVITLNGIQPIKRTCFYCSILYFNLSIYFFCYTKEKLHSKFQNLNRLCRIYGGGMEITQKVQEISFLKIYATTRNFLQPAVATLTTNVTSDASVWRDKTVNQSVPRVVKELLGQFKTLIILKTFVECESNLEDLSEEERKRPPREVILL